MAFTDFQKLVCKEIARRRITDLRTFFEEYQDKATETTKPFIGWDDFKKMLSSRDDTLLLQAVHEFISLIRTLKGKGLVFLENVEAKKMIRVSIVAANVGVRIHTLLKEYQKVEIVPSSELNEYINSGFLTKDELRYEVEKDARLRSEKITKKIAYVSITVSVLIAIGTTLFNYLNYDIAKSNLNQASLARKDARLISGLELRPDIILRSDFKRIKITKKPDIKAIKEKAPYFQITNKGAIDAIQMEIQLFICEYSQAVDKVGKDITTSFYNWTVEKLPPQESKVFPVDDWIYIQPTATNPLWKSVLEIRVTYRRNPDKSKFSQSAYYFVGPQEFWVNEKDHSSLNAERYRPIVKAAIGRQSRDLEWFHSDILHLQENTR